MKGRCDYEMNASLAMYSRAYQDFPKRVGNIGHVHGRTMGEIFFFLIRGDRECIYARCVGLGRSNTHLT